MIRPILTQAAQDRLRAIHQLLNAEIDNAPAFQFPGRALNALEDCALEIEQLLEENAINLGLQQVAA